MKLSHTKQCEIARRVELLSILILMIFALCIALHFKQSCKDRRGNHAVVKSPNHQLLKTVSTMRSNY